MAFELAFESKGTELSDDTVRRHERKLGWAVGVSADVGARRTLRSCTWEFDVRAVSSGELRVGGEPALSITQQVWLTALCLCCRAGERGPLPHPGGCYRHPGSDLGGWRQAGVRPSLSLSLWSSFSWFPFCWCNWFPSVLIRSGLL